MEFKFKIRLAEETPEISPAAAEPKIGDKMPDGTVYAGVSPSSGKKMYAMSTDDPLTMTFNDAQQLAEVARDLRIVGHDDWRMPTSDELDVLFNNRTAIGGFKVSGSDPAGWYWSAATLTSKRPAWCQRFSDGVQFYNSKDYPSSVRLVR